MGLPGSALRCPLDSKGTQSHYERWWWHFYCNHAMDVYAALGIEKKRIDKRQAWEITLRLIYTLFGIPLHGTIAAS